MVLMFLAGVGTVLGMMLLAYSFYSLGKKHRVSTKPAEIDAEVVKQQQQLLKDFKEVMSYNENKAYERKRAY